MLFFLACNFCDLGDSPSLSAKTFLLNAQKVVGHDKMRTTTYAVLMQDERLTTLLSHSTSPYHPIMVSPL